jgi:O-antigen/teichoic acid export membrane protein
VAIGADITARTYLRGSSLLLVGRIVSILTNFLVQVLTVRYLAKSEFGAFAWAMAVTAMAASTALLGLDRGIGRFVPVDQERGDERRMWGTVALALALAIGLGLAIVAATLGLRGVLLRSVADNPRAVGLLLLLIGLAPIQALDALLQALLAVFASPRSIFLRRHVLGPGLKLAAVAAVMALGGSARLLAAAHLTAGLIGVVTCGLLLRRVLRSAGLLPGVPLRLLRLPVRRTLAYCLPLLSTDLVMMLKATIAVVLLERFRGTTGVADLRAVTPVAGLCLVVLQSLRTLYTPTASRLLARNDRRALGDLYRRSTVWIAVATFPVFAACVFLAEPIVALLFGHRYAGAGLLLAIVAAGNYFNAALGLNTYTLQVYARIRYITAANVLSILAAAALNLTLIPRFGAAGAAGAIAGTFVIYNLLHHAGLLLQTPLRPFEPSILRVYAMILGAVAALCAVRFLLDAPPAAMAAGIVAVTVLLVLLTRGETALQGTFPELRRVPLVGRLLGAPCA